jgi:hypothetical protein
LTHTVVTIGSRNYLAQAVTLMLSLAQNDPLVRRVLVVSDGVPEGLSDDPALAGVALHDGAAYCDDLAAMAAYYEPIELNTAIKPFVLRALLAEPGATTVTYLDPDIVVYRPLERVRAVLDSAGIALTPHLTAPLPGPALPNDLGILRSGVYNLGFIGLRAGPEAIAFADWWAGHCRYDCRVAFDEGLFTDQRWVDMAPGFFDSIALLRDPAHNLAYWSLPGHQVGGGPGVWEVDGQPLVFFHFSGFDPARPDLLSRHQTRTEVEPGSPLAAILADYGRRLQANGYGRWSATPYGFLAFADGRRITGLMRRCLLDQARSGGRVDLGASTSAGLDAADPAWTLSGLPPVSRLMARLWRETPGAEARFPRLLLQGRRDFQVFCQANGLALGADPRALLAARGLAEASPVPAGPAPAIALSPSHRIAGGDQARDWFADGGPDEPAERAVIAAWRANPALRDRFSASRIGDVALLAHCAGPETLAGRFDPSRISPAGWARLLKIPTQTLCAWTDPGHAERSLGRGPDTAAIHIAFGLAPRARWPAAVQAQLAGAWSAPGRHRLFGALPLLLDRLWAARGDLQQAFDLRSARGRLRYLNWFARVGLDEYGLEAEALPVALRTNPVFRLLAGRRRGTHAPVLVGPGCSFAVVTRGAGLPVGLPDPPADALVLDLDTGAWRSMADAAATVPAPRAIRRLLLAGAPDDWALAMMLATRGGVRPLRTAGWAAAADLERLADDWATDLVDEIWTDADSITGCRAPDVPLLYVGNLDLNAAALDF